MPKEPCIFAAEFKQLLIQKVSTYEDTDSEESMERTTTDCDSWKMTIANVATGRIMYKGILNEDTMTVSIVGWPQGIYVVKAWTDDASVSGKFMIENR